MRKLASKLAKKIRRGEFVEMEESYDHWPTRIVQS